MKVRAGGALLLLLTCAALVSGCGSGVYGSAATFGSTVPVAPPPSSPGVTAALPGYLLTNSKFGTFEALWHSNGNAALAAGSSLLVRATRPKPFGAWALTFTEPSAASTLRYRFKFWITGSRVLRRSTLYIRLQALSKTQHGLSQLKTVTEKVPTDWRYYSLPVPINAQKKLNGASYLRVFVYAQDHIKAGSWLRIYGAVVQQTVVSQ